jgi:hypothetical protein
MATAMMNDDRPAVVMDDNHRFFDGSLDPLGLQGIRRDGRGFRHASHHAETQQAGDDNVSAAFQHFIGDQN